MSTNLTLEQITERNKPSGLLSIVIPTTEQLTQLHRRWKTEGVPLIGRKEAKANNKVLYTSTRLTEFDKPLRTNTGELVCIRYVCNGTSIGQNRLANNTNPDTTTTIH